MYKVRIEHAGFDTTPFRFRHRYQAMDFVGSLMEENSITDGWLTVSLKNEPDTDQEEDEENE